MSTRTHPTFETAIDALAYSLGYTEARIVDAAEMHGIIQTLLACGWTVAPKSVLDAADEVVRTHSEVQELVPDLALELFIAWCRLNPRFALDTDIARRVLNAYIEHDPARLTEAGETK